MNVQDILLPEHLECHAEAVAAYLSQEEKMGQLIRFTGILERHGYSYNNAVVLWQEGLAKGFERYGEDATDYQVVCEARKFVKSII